MTVSNGPSGVGGLARAIAVDPMSIASSSLATSRGAHKAEKEAYDARKIHNGVGAVVWGRFLPVGTARSDVGSLNFQGETCNPDGECVAVSAGAEGMSTEAGQLQLLVHLPKGRRAGFIER